MNPQAEHLNNILARTKVLDLLSVRGKDIYFPREGILAQAAEARGKSINATIGIALGDDKKPLRLRQIEKRILLLPEDVFSYASSYGKPELRAIWKELMQKKNPSLKAKTSSPVVTCGLTHGLSMTGYLFINPGDSVLMPDMLWGNYRLILEHGYGAKIHTFRTFSSGGFDINAMKKGLEARPKALLLNFPNNPSGYTPTIWEAHQIADAIKWHGEQGNTLIVVLDDAYFGLVYEDGIYRESLFSLLAGIHENILAVKLDAITKEDYAWGFRVGFITYGMKNADDNIFAALEEKTAGAVRGSISNAPHISQSLALQAFSSPGYWQEKEAKFKLLKSRHDEVRTVLEDDAYSGHFKALPFNSGYFICIELKQDAEEVRQILLKKYDTGVISIGNLLRIAYSSVPKKDIRKLFDNIRRACMDAAEKS